MNDLIIYKKNRIIKELMESADYVIEYLFNVNTNGDNSSCYAKHAKDKEYVKNKNHQCHILFEEGRIYLYKKIKKRFDTKNNSLHMTLRLTWIGLMHIITEFYILVCIPVIYIENNNI